MALCFWVIGFATVAYILAKFICLNFDNGHGFSGWAIKASYWFLSLVQFVNTADNHSRKERLANMPRVPHVNAWICIEYLSQQAGKFVEIVDGWTVASEMLKREREFGGDIAQKNWNFSIIDLLSCFLRAKFSLSFDIGKVVSIGKKNPLMTPSK